MKQSKSTAVQCQFPSNEAATSMGFPPTDIGNAQRLVAQHGRDLRFCHPWNKWLVWDGRRWIKDVTGEVERRAKKVVRSIYIEAAETDGEIQRRDLADHAKRSGSQSRLRAMISSSRSEDGIPVLPKDLDGNPWLLNVDNGILDLHTGDLLPHQRENLITKLAPVKYDKDAECPIFLGFLERIFNNNPDSMRFLQEAVGYALTGNTREQCLFFLYGSGANGKSTLLETIKDLLGDYGHQAHSDWLMAKKFGGQIPNDLAAMRGARLVVTPEVESGRRLSEVKVKQLTGGDEIAARHLYGEWFSYKPEFKIFLAGNHKPVIHGTDHAIWRRIRLIPFNVEIPNDEQDKDLLEKLKTELSGILNWALDGCLCWQREGLALPQEVQEATQEYREEMDPLSGFLAERCIMTFGAEVMSGDLYQAYETWANAYGENKVVSKNEFAKKLKERGLNNRRETKGPQKGKSKWVGITLKGK